VHFGEALSWAVLLGVTMETARVVAQRVATRKLRNGKTAS